MLHAIYCRILLYRKHRRKEDPIRISERFGICDEYKYSLFTQSKRPSVWIHAASIGESNSIIEFIKILTNNGFFVICTTVTVTSAETIKNKLPENAIHQFFPIPDMRYINKFLAVWNPKMIFFTESEIWPNLILSLGKSGHKIYLLNARLSNKSYKLWYLLSCFSKKIFQQYTAIYVQSHLEIERFQKLGCSNVKYCGNLKLDSMKAFLENSKIMCNTYKDLFNKLIDRSKPTIFLANMHLAEINVVIAVIKYFQSTCNIIVAPRKQNEIEVFIKKVETLNLSTFIFNNEEYANNKIECGKVIINAALNVMGMLYLNSQYSVIGGSFVDGIGGHSPVEAITANCISIIGNYYENCKEIVENLLSSGSMLTANSDNIVATLEKTIRNHKTKEDIEQNMKIFVEDTVQNSVSGKIWKDIQANGYLIN